MDTRYRYVLTAEGDFFWSSNRGNSWARSQEPEGPQGHYFYGSSILASPTTEGRVYIAGSGYSNPAVYESQNHGLRFKPMTTGLPDTLVFQLATNPEETMIFAATEVGPYVYITKEKRWYDLAGDAAPDQTYWSVEYIPEPGIARFGTYGRGIWDFQVTGKTRR